MAITKIKGDVSEGRYTIGVIVARWNSFITDKLLEGAVDVLKSNGYKDDQVIVAYCPGAYEIPLSAKKLLPKVDGVIVLGAVIRGDTPHFDYVCDAVNKGVLELNLQSEKPVSFGVLTTDDVEQAAQRAGIKEGKGNKGSEASLALLEMLSLIEQIKDL